MKLFYVAGTLKPYALRHAGRVYFFSSAEDRNQFIINYLKIQEANNAVPA